MTIKPSPKKEMMFDLVLDESILGLKDKIIPSPDSINEWVDIQERNLYLPIVIDDRIIDYLCYYIRKWNLDDKDIPINERKPIKLFIHSDGGEVIPTMHLIDLMELSKTPIHTIAQGKAYSCAGYILMAGHKRFCYKNSTCLIHDGSTGAIGNTGKVFDTIEFQRKMDDRIESFVISKSKITREDYDRHYRKDWFLFADEMLELGIVDEIVEEIV